MRKKKAVKILGYAAGKAAENKRNDKRNNY